MNRKPQTTNPVHRTRHVCKKCLGRINWVWIPVEAHWQIIDGERVWVPYDWHIDVHCFCGEVKEEAIVEECYKNHRRMICDSIHDQQNEKLRQVLGVELAEYTHELNGGSF